MRIVAGLALGLGVLAGCGGGVGTVDSTTPETTSTSAPPTTTSLVADPTTSTIPNASVDTLLVVGDWGTGTAPEGAVAGAMQRYFEEHGAAAILTTGDNLLSEDAEFIMHPYGWAEEAGLTWWITWGNHDVETPSRIDIVNQTFDDPPRWTALTWGQVEILVLDSTQLDSSEQLEFLEAKIADSEGPTIVVFHHPASSCISHEQGPGQNGIVSLFDDDVMLVLHGHEHNYQRFEVDGVTYAITGGGGSPLSPIADCPETGPQRLAGEELHHFLALTQENGALRLQAIDVTGAIFDEATVALD